MQRHLDPRRAALADEARGDDAGVVEHHGVARPQQTRQFGDDAIRERVADDQQPRRIARLARPFGHQMPRQGEIERVDAHGGPV